MPDIEFEDKIDELLARSNIVAPAVPVDVVAKALGAELRYLPFEGDVSGMLYRDEERAVIGINSLQPVARQRFTIAHEIGHLILHEGRRPVFVDTGYKVNFRGLGAQDTEEREANRFASCLLMPRQFLIVDLQDSHFDLETDERVDALRKRYKVSLQAMSIRLSQLGFPS